jgi:hypothetical protein
MKTPGPPPTPTNLKLLRGNPGKRQLNQREPDPEPSIPSCPQHLNKVARREWRRVTKQLFALGLVTQLDRSALAAYCDAYSRWAAASIEIQHFGLILKSPSGYPMQSPYHPLSGKGKIWGTYAVVVSTGRQWQASRDSIYRAATPRNAAVFGCSTTVL